MLGPSAGRDHSSTSRGIPYYGHLSKLLHDFSGEFPGGSVYVGTLENGGVGLAPYHDFEEEVPAELKAEVEAIQEAIAAGELSTGWPPE